MLYLVRAVVPSGLVMWVAVELRGDCWTVRLAYSEPIPVLTVKMLGSPAIQVSIHNCIAKFKRSKQLEVNMGLIE